MTKLKMMCTHCHCPVHQERDVTESSYIFADESIGDVYDYDPQDFFKIMCDEGCEYESIEDVKSGKRVI